MKYGKSILILMFVIFLFTISAVNAIDVNDTLVSSENADQTTLSLNNEITYDNLQISEENNTLTETNNDEILGSFSESTYSELAREIGSGGNIVLSHNYYAYDSGSTITISVDNSVIDGNGAVIDMNGSSNMRALYVGASDVTIKNIVIKNANYGIDGIGAAIFFSGSGTVSNCNFTNNKVVSPFYSYGGALYFSGSGTVSNCNFNNNKASSPYGDGGAVYFQNNSNVENCNFTQNFATLEGGAIWMRSGTVLNSNFVENQAYGTNAGAIHMIAGNVSNCDFVRNSAYRDGGAIYFNDGSETFSNEANVINCYFAENSVRGDSGAIFGESENGFQLGIHHVLFLRLHIIANGIVFGLHIVLLSVTKTV